MSQAVELREEAGRLMRWIKWRTEDEKRVILPLVSSLYATADGLDRISIGRGTIAKWKVPFVPIGDIKPVSRNGAIAAKEGALRVQNPFTDTVNNQIWDEEFVTERNRGKQPTS